MAVVIWIIGLSGAGKTSVARALYERWKPRRPALVFLDGDELREVWGGDLGHTPPTVSRTPGASPD